MHHILSDPRSASWILGLSSEPAAAAHIHAGPFGGLAVGSEKTASLLITQRDGLVASPSPALLHA